MRCFIVSLRHFQKNKPRGLLGPAKKRLKDGEEPRERSIKSIEKLPSTGGVLHRYIDLNFEIYDVNSVRGSSYIPTPEKYAHPNVDLLIYEMKTMNVLDGECYTINQNKQKIATESQL